MICLLSFLLIVRFATSQDLDLFNNNSSERSENILCRGCGSEITYSSSIILKISPSSQYSFYDSIFQEDKVLVQVLMSDFFLPYYMITTNQSNCLGVSEWEKIDSWFPGYHWKPCICPDCGALVGWLFEPTNPNLVDQPGKLFGLILSSLIGESYLNSLTVVP